MLSQAGSAFNLRSVMEEYNVLPFDLSDLGAETRNTLGCFLLAMLHETALGRCSMPQERLKPFHVYWDHDPRSVGPNWYQPDDFGARAKKGQA